MWFSKTIIRGMWEQYYGRTSNHYTLKVYRCVSYQLQNRCGNFVCKISASMYHDLLEKCWYRRCLKLFQRIWASSENMASFFCFRFLFRDWHEHPLISSTIDHHWNTNTYRIRWLKIISCAFCSLKVQLYEGSPKHRNDSMHIFKNSINRPLLLQCMILYSTLFILLLI